MPIDLTELRDVGRATALKTEAGSALSRGQRAEAARFLGAAAKADPFDDDAALLAAFLCHEQGACAEAVTHAAHALTARPYNPQALNVLAVACLDAGYPALSREALAGARRLAPALPAAAPQRKPAHAFRRRPADALTAVVRPVLVADPARLTAAIVVQDDPAALGRTLDSLEGLAAEIVVVDLRRDRRLPLALADDARYLAETHDAGEAAGWNHALAIASCGWVLLLAAGETLEPGAIEPLKERLRRTGHIGHPLGLRYAGTAPPRLGSSMRLMRNAPGVRFVGQVHASPMASIRKRCREWGLGWGEPGLTLHCPGPALDPRTARQALERDALIEAPSATAAAHRSWYIAAAGDPQRALDALRDAQELALRRNGEIIEPEREALSTVEAYCLMRLDRAAEMLGALGASNDGQRPANLLFLEGTAALATGRSEHAAAQLAHALARSEQVGFFDALPEVTGAGLPNLLGTALIETKQPEEAAQAFEVALAREATNLEAQLGLLGVSLARQDHRAVLGQLDRLVAANGGELKVWLTGAAVLRAIPGFQSTHIDWLEEALRRFPDDPPLIDRLAEAHLAAGVAERAVELWRRSSSEHNLAGRFAACLAADLDLPEVQDKLRSQLIAGMLAWYQRLWQQQAVETLDGILLRLDRAIAQVPDLREETAGWLDQAGQPEAAARVRAL